MTEQALNPHQLPVDLDTIRPLTDELSLREGMQPSAMAVSSTWILAMSRA